MENIRVAVRVRVFLPDEGSQRCVAVSGNQVTVGEDRQFAFDDVFDMDATSETVNNALAAPLVDAFVNGYTVSTIAYGQTGAGKTHTMSCLSSDVVRRVSSILRTKAPVEGAERPEFRFSAVEVYNEHISDLIGSTSDPTSFSTVAAPASLLLREDARSGVYIQGLSEVTVDDEEELLAWIERSTANRRTASTLVNATSSRSHCLLTLTLTHNGTVSRFGLVDLAGSERIKKAYGRCFSTGVVPETDERRSSTSGGTGAKSVEVASRIREGISINSGLLALGNVIVALCKRKPYVPYRTSKLTRLLQPMLSGNSKTTMIACVSPAVSSFEETLNTLKYADHAKSIRTTPFQIASDTLTMENAEKTILSLRTQLDAAIRQLQERKSSSTTTLSVGVGVRLEELEELLTRERRLTRRLQEDLFHAEYTAMVEVEKRKSLEQRLVVLEPAHHSSTEATTLNTPESVEAARLLEGDALFGAGAGGGDAAVAKQKLVAKLNAECDELKVLKKQKECKLVSLVGIDEATMLSQDCGNVNSFQERVSPEIEKKERQIQQLLRQNEKTTRALEHSMQLQAGVLNVKQHLEEELARAEAQAEATEMERQEKEEERRNLQIHYQQRLRKAEEEAAEYRRQVQEATAKLSMWETNVEAIKQLQSQVSDMNGELNWQRYAVREGQQQANRMAASHAQELNQLQKQIRSSEGQVARLQVQLQRKERGIARAKSNGSSVNNNRRSPSFNQKNSTPHQPSPQSLRQEGQSQHNRSTDVQTKIDVELMALVSLEKELDELTADRDRLNRTVNDAKVGTEGDLKWKKAIKGFTMRLKHLRKDLESGKLDKEEQLRCSAEKADIENKLCQLQSFEPTLAQASKQLAELEDTIDSLQETRKYRLRRVRQLQQESPSVEREIIRASALLQSRVENNTTAGKRRG